MSLDAEELAASPAADDAAATRVRYRVVGLTVLLAAITYLDRACIASLASAITAEFSLSKRQMSLVFSAFALAYTVFEIPTARWADRAGTRSVLARIVVWWSVFTMATAASFNYASLLVVRFLFGAGEAGAWPSVARTFSRWIPYRERGTVQGIFFAGAHLGGGLTPIIVALLVHNFHCNWRTIFVLFGMIGFAWALAWRVWFRDEPARHPAVNAQELQLILDGRMPDQEHGAGWDYWKKLLTQRNTLALYLMYLPNSVGYYFCITWLPRYLTEKHGLSGKELAILSGLPLVLSVFADVTGGKTTDWAVRRWGPRLGRAGVGFVSYAVAGAAMLLGALATEPMIAAGLIAVATAASMFMFGAAWGTCQDIGGSHTGVVSATMNTAGQIGAMVSPVLITELVEGSGNWNAALILIGSLFLCGAACWCFIDPRRKVFA